MTTNCDILIFVEHKDRELQTTKKLKNLLELKFGFKVVIRSSIYDPIISLVFDRPKCIISPSTGFGKGSPCWLFYSLYKENIKYINLNYEQLISSWKGKYKSGKHKISKNKQYQCVWGQSFKKFLIDTGTKPELITVTGRLTDGYIKNLSIDETKQIKTSLRNSINILDNQTLVFIALTDGLAFVNEKKVKYIASQGADEVNLRKHIQIVKREMIDLFTSLNKFLAQSGSNEYSIIVRPHPSVSTEQYKRFLRKNKVSINKQLTFNKDHSALDWLITCDKYVTNYSTLCLDSFFLGKDTAIYRPVDSKKDNEYWYTNSGKEITSIEDWKQFLSKPNEIEISQEFKQKLNSVISTDKSPFNEICELIAVLKLNSVNSPTCKYLFLRIALCILQSPRRTLGSLIRHFSMKSTLLNGWGVKKGLQVDFISKREIVNHEIR